ncbi:DNA repair protein RadC [Tenacibaculum mesophilum]|uniref:DNA repair protein n=1 Tax=Tenacibaculum mesophilum TaxID=104268 RepID=A0ABM7CIY6_9FLAO|nr:MULTISPECIES: JAB domain-containing protein [Tenacibaculum]AZJ33794.1 DNA repair protein [Tenacibaculum mesophilum]MDX8554695.1 DNA repair protein [Tenacibaculum sp. 1B UA]QFS29035.1 DNA repair protein [Tenacibaculum mesophilum]SHF53565.1 DNA repair protein RadC [Tenacibaculum mesophilum]
MDIKLTEQEKIKILNSDDIYGIMQRILLRDNKIDQNREHFWVIGLANNNRILFIELISLGTVNATLVEPMEVFSFALQKRAVKIILCHNHPSGELTPSDNDKNLTDRLIQVGIIVNTHVIDHLIISDKSYLSFADNGLLQELAKSTKYVPKYVLEQRLKKEASEIAKRSEKIEIAKNLKRKGLDIITIADATGLTEEEVKKLRVKRS